MRVYHFCFIIIAFISGLTIGFGETSRRYEETMSKITGVPIEKYTCNDKGCSFLVEHPNQIREWLWVPRIKPVGKHIFK